MEPFPRPHQVRKSVGPSSRTSLAVNPRFYPIRRIGLWGDPDLFATVGKFILYVIILIEELRMVMVKPRSREGSVSERLCNVWLDDARDELVIVYETVNKLCIGSHVSK
ncbi:hypothetical protein IGI04_023633 [Brassica rapa subsp. trilocularis]|uniref:Uncharacterized protein n=1 Tax=Brassica rapa subsp. trilocularis TaxID=1813537 RepID=A0ABQ7M710_BRACM|nr:hypothetical protein IGI04_023633 [Brassica rapa subsp. trilocularis]